MDGRILWRTEPEGVPRMTEDTNNRALRLKTLGNAVCPSQAYQIHRHDRNRGVCQYLPLWNRRCYTLKEWKVLALYIIGYIKAKIKTESSSAFLINMF